MYSLHRGIVPFRRGGTSLGGVEHEDGLDRSVWHQIVDRLATKTDPYHRPNKDKARKIELEMRWWRWSTGHVRAISGTGRTVHTPSVGANAGKSGNNGLVW